MLKKKVFFVWQTHFSILSDTSQAQKCSPVTPAVKFESVHPVSMSEAHARFWGARNHVVKNPNTRQGVFGKFWFVRQLSDNARKWDVFSKKNLLLFSYIRLEVIPILSRKSYSPEKWDQHYWKHPVNFVRHEYQTLPERITIIFRTRRWNLIFLSDSWSKIEPPRYHFFNNPTSSRGDPYF